MMMSCSGKKDVADDGDDDYVVVCDSSEDNSFDAEPDGVEDYSLPDIEWMIHMNLGSLYLNIEEYQKSISHTEIAYRYISNNKNIDDFLNISIILFFIFNHIPFLRIILIIVLQILFVIY